MLHMDRWLMAALLLLSAICCSAADDGDNVEAANFIKPINTTVCTLNACPSGQFATSNDCKPCFIGSYKAAAGLGCCQKCNWPEMTYNISDGQAALFGATGCGEPQGHCVYDLQQWRTGVACVAQLLTNVW
jgi:hypothetical protein